MTKSQFKKEAKGMMNSVRVIGGITLTHVGWMHNGWRILPEGETFENAKEYTYEPLASFHTLEDLLKVTAI